MCKFVAKLAVAGALLVVGCGSETDLTPVSRALDNLTSAPRPRSFDLFIIYASTMAEVQFSSYSQIPAVARMRSATIPISPFHLNHEKRFQELQDEFSDFVAGSRNPVVVLGYSVGGKFGARLARERRDVSGLFLMDPVDGGAPIPVLSKIFPVFIDTLHEPIRVPSLIVESELGGRNGPTSAPCVPAGLGAEHFSAAIDPSFLVQRLFITGAGHLDFLGKPYPPGYYLARLGCAPGSAGGEQVIGATKAAWQGFLGALASNR